MDQTNLTVTFGPAAGDPATLSKHGRQTLAALYRHPLAHNLEWIDAIALFEALGTVEQKGHNEITFSIGDEHQQIHKRHGKDLMTDDVMALRRLLTQTGWAPSAPGAHRAAAAPGADQTPGAPAGTKEGPDLLAVVDHHEARIYHLDIGAADVADHVIHPYDPHHILHHLSHKDQSRERGQRSPEDAQFYERIAQALLPGGRIVLAGHGKGHSNAVHHLGEFLREHHTDVAGRVTSVTVTDIAAVTSPQLLEMGRRALTA